MNQLLLATSNPGKLRDLRQCLSELKVQLLSPRDLGLLLQVPETGRSYTENARLKAQAYFQATGTPSLGEDSGLEIDALDGEPGRFSARFEGLADGPVKNLRILELLTEVPPSRRSCRYRCALVLARQDGIEIAFEASCAGRIALAPAGEGGFGFDPIVLIPRLGRTLAELSEEARLRINHRGRAARKLAAYLKSRVSL